jgi:galacturan 1,4-alpha-galacturonidase
MRNIWGTVSNKFDPRAGSMVCSAPDRCSNIRVENVTVTVPSGKAPVYACRHLDEKLLGVTCVEPEKDRDNTNG